MSSQSPEKVFLALGSNIGNKQEYIEQAIEHIKKFVDVEKVASFIETEPWGDTEQDSFLNTCLMGSTIFSSDDLLRSIKIIEKDLGRKERRRWGPREIDIDIIFYGDSIIEADGLTIPHKELHNRLFVLQPLDEIAPDFVHPKLKKTIHELFLSAEESS